MKHIFESENIIFINLDKKLVNEYLIMVNDPEVANKISHNVRIFTLEEELDWVRLKLEENSLCFSMLEKDTNEYIGNIEIMEINNNIGELGIVITPKKQNMHYGTEAIKAFLNYAYEAIKLDGMELNVFSTNTRAIRCYENVGFKNIGQGKTKDDLHMIIRK